MSSCSTSPLRLHGIWVVLVAMAASLITLVIALGSPVPLWDDWANVPVLTGRAPLTARWLWELHNEHRLPLPRLVYVASFRAAGGDVRGVMLVSVLLLTAAVGLLLAAAARARGRPSWTDAALPLLLLHAGHEDNLLWAFQLSLVLPAALGLATLATLSTVDGRPTRVQVAAVGAAAFLLQLCGVPGLVLGSAFGGWLLWQSIRPGPSTAEPRRAGEAGRALPAVLGLLAAALAAAYLVGYRGNPTHPAPGPWRAALRVATELLDVGLGPAAAIPGDAAAAAVTALVAASALALLVWWWRSPRQRVCAEAQLAALLATGGLVVAVAWGRSGFMPGAGRAPRYVTLVAPLVAACYVAWCRIPWTTASRVVQAGLLGVCATLLPFNTCLGVVDAQERRGKLQALADDLERGLPIEQVARRHDRTVFPSAPLLRERLEMLRATRIGPFAARDRALRFLRAYPFLRAPLLDLRSVRDVPPHEGRVDGRPVLVLPGGGEAVFDVRPGLHRARGRYGVLVGYGTPPPVSGQRPFEATYFTASFRADDGTERELLATPLRPRERMQDQASHPFDVALPGGAGALVLRTRIGPPGTAAAEALGDWGYWGDVVLR